MTHFSNITRAIGFVVAASEIRAWKAVDGEEDRIVSRTLARSIAARMPVRRKDLA